MSQLRGEFAPPLLVADVLLPLGAVLGAAGHHDFERLRLPFRSQLDERVIEVNADAAAHANDHRLAFHRLQSLLEMCHQIRGDERDALQIADSCCASPDLLSLEINHYIFS